jgi:pimeloyl-ACP methyl ester carboxylesterase
MRGLRARLGLWPPSSLLELLEECFMKKSATEFPKLDQPVVLQHLFHPRKDLDSRPPSGAVDYDIRVEEGVEIGCRFYVAQAGDPNILYFHGNGEIVSDHDKIGPLYNQYGLSLLVADYRGYGRSGGEPTVTSVIQDAHVIYRETKRWLKDQGRDSPLLLMGRSLGSASVLELGVSWQREVGGLIIESGFAWAVPVLQALGLNTNALDITEADCLGHVEKIKKFKKPTLIIHAQYDQLIPLSHAETLFAHSGAEVKKLEVIPGAGHNTVLTCAGMRYFEMIKEFAESIVGKT